MKTVHKIKEKKRKSIKKPKVKNQKEKVLIVAQEIKFARLLSGNEKKIRDRVLKTFKKWLLSCFEKGYEFNEDDFIRVWKGLFYAVWMSDKPLVQEELCETIASILDLFPAERVKDALLMTRAGFKLLAFEWYGIDQHRLDKYLMLVRRYQRGSLRVLRRCGWSLAACEMYSDMLSNPEGLLAARTPLHARNAGSMLMHFVDCFLEELAKVSQGDIPAASVTELLRPFCAYMSGGHAPLLRVACRRLLTALLRQTQQGLQYRERTRAWQQMGCPRGGPEALELASDDEGEGLSADEEDDADESAPTPLDPRAGRVDVVLHPLPVDAEGVARVLRELLAKAGSGAYKRTKICLQRFEQLASDEYPLPVEDVFGPDDEKKRRASGLARELRALEKNLVASADELALRGLSRKHRKRVLAKTRAGISVVADTDPNITSTNGDWAVEATETEPAEKKASKHKLSTSNKENVHKERHAKKAKLSDTPEQTRKDKKHADKHKIRDNNKLPANNKVTSKSNDEVSKNIAKVDKTNAKPDNKGNKKLDKRIEKINSKINVKLDKSNEKLNLMVNKKHISKINKNNKSKENSKIQVQLENKIFKKTQKQSNEKINSTQILKIQEKNINNKLSKDRAKKTDKIRSKFEERSQKKTYDSPKKVKFVLKNNSMQGTIDYYKSIRQSPNIPYDGSKKPSKTNLKPSTPSPLNPFAKKKLRLK